jgi:uncharacterized Zn finger protein
MSLSSHPSADELRQAIQSRGGNITCNVCGGEEFSMEQVTTVDAGGGYGSHRLKRADLICGNCGHVMGFELEKMREVSPE